jgi:hypothetical protein
MTQSKISSAFFVFAKSKGIKNMYLPDPKISILQKEILAINKRY